MTEKNNNYEDIEVGSTVRFKSSYYSYVPYTVEAPHANDIDLHSWKLKSPIGATRYINSVLWYAYGGYIVPKIDETVRTREQIETEMQKVLVHGVRGPNVAWEQVHKWYDEIAHVTRVNDTRNNK